MVTKLMNRSCQSRMGFTLVELLVSLALIGVLVALLLPAVQRARTAARGIQCRNNLKQVALALHQFHETHGAFPPARIIEYQYAPVDENADRQGLDEPSWIIHLLPYLEQQAFFDQWDLYLPYANQPTEIKFRPLHVFLCPERHSVDDAIAEEKTVMIAAPCGCLAGIQTIPGGAVTDYVGNHGDLEPGASGLASDFYWGGQGTGVIISSAPAFEGTARLRGWSNKVRLGDISDGSSNTFLLGESHVPADQLNSAPYNGAAYHGRHLLHHCRVAGPGVPLAHHPRDQRASVYSFGSFHRGFIPFAMADGSVRPVSTVINTSLAGHLANRADGQTLGEF